jgi:hypothetical protein
MKNPFFPFTPISNFRSLGTGRKKETVVVTNGCFEILFFARVLHNNRITSKSVRFDNGKLFHTDSETINGEKVYLFWPSETLQEEWGRQNEIARIEEWLKTALSKDVFAFLDCVAMIRQKPQPNYRYDYLVWTAKSEIRRNLDFLSLPELRRLKSVIENMDCGKAA